MKFDCSAWAVAEHIFFAATRFILYRIYVALLGRVSASSPREDEQMDGCPVTLSWDASPNTVSVPATSKQPRPVIPESVHRPLCQRRVAHSAVVECWLHDDGPSSWLGTGTLHRIISWDRQELSNSRIFSTISRIFLVHLICARERTRTHTEYSKRISSGKFFIATILSVSVSSIKKLI